MILALIVASVVAAVFYLRPQYRIIYPESSISEDEVIPEITLEEIFDSEDTWTATLSAETVHTIMVTGDTIPARTVNFQTIQAGDFLWPYREVAEYTSDADLTYIDLETPLLRDCLLSNEGFKFCGDARHMQGLSLLGADVANIANNHIGNYGLEGVLETQGHLKDAGILYAGTSEIVYKDIEGTKFAFLGYNDIESQAGVNDADIDLIVAQIEEAAKNADVVVVQYHWGVEYVTEPSTRQTELAHMAVDHGADLVIGNHPHWIQPVEIYQGKVITYAHGNFVFDQMWSQKTREGVVGRYTFYGDKLIDVTFRPLVIEDFGRARWADSVDAARILEEMKIASYELSDKY